MGIMYHVVLDGRADWCYHMGMNKTKTTTTEYTLPTELASLFINNDWSIVDYIDDEYYEEAITNFLYELELEGHEIFDVVDNSESFTKYHDMSDYGVLACECSTFIAR